MSTPSSPSRFNTAPASTIISDLDCISREAIVKVTDKVADPPLITASSAGPGAIPPSQLAPSFQSVGSTPPPL